MSTGTSTVTAEAPDVTTRDGLLARLRRLWPGLRAFVVDAVLQVRVLRKAYPGVMHALIFWGVTVQVVGTAINLLQMQLFLPLVELGFPRGGGYLLYELVMDLAGVAILIGALMAAFRRLVLRPPTLETRWDDLYAIGILLLIPLLGFTVEGLRLVATAPPWADWSPVGKLVAGLFRGLGMSPEAAFDIHTSFWWAHMAAALVFIASIPFTKLRHLVTAPLNVVVRPRGKESALTPIEDIEEAETLGVGRVSEFTPQQLLSFDACVRCGRCEEACPAALSGMPFSPRTFIQSLRAAMLDTLVYADGGNPGPQAPTLDERLGQDAPWYCTTCGACLMRCPVYVNPVAEIIDLRRYQTLSTGEMPGAVGAVLRKMERQGNPWGLAEDRAAWAADLGVRVLEPGEETDVLFFVGCAFAFDDRNKKAARAFARLLQAAGVDFAILGEAEACCGETARRLGHEYLFQVMARQNIETLAEFRFKRIVAQCTHCFNTLKHEYPQFGGSYPVQHYTELLAELAPRLPGTAGGPDLGRVTYHDSCYLGRYNQIYAQPRGLLDRAGVHRVEMARRGEDSFCCGGGGGQMWLETDAETRINHRRLDQALAVQADTVATACPYCLLMFDDAVRSRGLGDRVQVLDLAEILAGSLPAPPESSGAPVSAAAHEERA